MSVFQKIPLYMEERRINSWVFFFGLVFATGVFKLVTVQYVHTNILLTLYSITVALYILSRFAIAYLYTPDTDLFDPTYEPTVSFGVPSKNEEENIYETIMKIAASDYPKRKFNIIAVNDGST